MQPYFRRSFLVESGVRWDPKVRFGQDVAFYTACLAHGARLYVVPEAYYAYVRNAQGISHTAPPVDAVAHRLDVNQRLLTAFGDRRELAGALRTRGRALKHELRCAQFRARMATVGPIRAVFSQPAGAAGVAFDTLTQKVMHYQRRVREEAERSLSASN